MSKSGERILRGAREARAFVRGEAKEGFVVHVPERIDVKSIRAKLAMTQQEFAMRFGFAYDAVRDWESRRRQPDRAARVLLTVISHRPDVVEEALSRAGRMSASARTTRAA